MAKVINVFYDAQGYPFKDKELTTRFPIVGSAFQGADNTTEIRFYVDELSANRQWCVFGKLPNGKKGFKVLTESVLDEDEDRYYPFMLSQFFTQYKGDLYLSLGGYYGNIVELNEEQEYELQQVSGEMTGAIKLNIAYSVQMEGSDYDELPQWLQALASKLDTNKGIVVIPNTSASVSGYQEDQLFYSKADQMLYKLVSGALVPQGIGIIKTNSIGVGIVLDKSKVALDMCFVIFNSTNVIFKKSNTDNNGIATFYSDLEFANGNNSGNDTLGRSYFKVNVSTGAITESQIEEKNIYNKSQIDEQFYNKSQADTKFASKSGNNTFSGTNTFENAPKSNAQPSNNDDLTRKDYVDNETSAIDNKISILASPSNKALSESEIDSKISTAEATYRGLFNSVAELNAYSGAKDKNDYAWVKSTDSAGNTLYTRYIYNGNAWLEQWTISNISFTTAQWNAINSGATSVLIEYLEGVYNGTIKVAKAIDSDKLGGNNASEYVRSVNHLTPVDGNIDTLATITAFSIEVDDVNEEDLALYVTHAGEFETNALSIVDEGDNAYLCITVN